MFEWELRAQEWSDEHPHDEYVYVLDGEVHVTAGGITVVTGPGGLVRVPAGVRGHYAAPDYAHLLSVYPPQADGTSDPRGALRELDR
jgi:quercetin dioxygenase-like cupin family protein